MRKKIASLIELVNGFLLLTGILGLLAFICSSLLGVDFREQLLFLLPVLLIYGITLLADRISRGFLLFFLISVGSIAATFLISMPVVTRVILIALSVILVILSIASRLKENRNPLTRPTLVTGGFFAVIYIITVSTPDLACPELSRLSYCLTFVYAILIVVYRNLSNLGSYLEFNRFVQNIPTKQIDRTNGGVLILYTVLMILLMIFLPLTGAERVFGLLGKGLRMLLRLLFRNAGSGADEEADTAEEVLGGGSMSGLDIGETKPTPAWLTALYEFLAYAMIILLGLLALAVLVILFIRMVKKFYRPTRENEDVQEFIDAKDETKTSTLPSVKDLLKRPDWLDFSPNASVRRAYRKAILRKNQEAPSQALTPSELELYAGLPECESTRLLHTLYEKARYTDAGVTKEEAKALKR